ncbi:HGL013Wp [Eremothecium sinecaudum]|uniref:HGL013Wp n=1 Tax=Eremothecium sinecaudum TaxID=45286 RepID=A0A0X8HVK1_9SACH|nr:HGL013Wp [Eremothecium sinecaudum]AMD22327.1 HGL013Wp [Eremothecium sinecaudum]
MTKGLVRIRLARIGRKHAPLYNIVVTTAKRTNYKKPIEVIGEYLPKPVTSKLEAPQSKVYLEKQVQLDMNRAKYWISVGAQATEPVVRIFKKCGILDSNWGVQRSLKGKVIEPRVETFE